MSDKKILGLIDVKKIKDNYKRIRKHLSFVILIIILISQLIPKKFTGEEEFLVSLTFMFGFIFLDILFEINRKVTNAPKELKRYEGFMDIYNNSEFQSWVEKQIYDDQKVDIKIIGISLRKSLDHIFELIKDYRHKNALFNITFVVLDQDLIDVVFINENEKVKNKFKRKKKTIEEEINGFVDEFIDIKSSKISFNYEIIKYNHLPNLYGFLIDDTYLYLGTTYWENGYLRGAGGKYDFYQEDDDFGGTDKIDIFNSWIERNRKLELNLKS